MRLPKVRPPAARFCCDCGEKITDETRPRWGGPRCQGCRAIAGPRARALAAAALVASSGLGYGAGRLASSSPAPPAPAPLLASVPAGVARPDAPPPPPPEPLHACGARTKRGTRCKRMVRGEGYCYQHRPR